ncbi:MAG: MBOAT family O-acyltransferase [Fulvivirga sp.]
MLFNSVEYLLFLPLVFIVYWSLKNHRKAQNFFILISSYFFYGIWDYRFLSLIFLSSLVDYIIGSQLGKNKSGISRKLFLASSLLVNLGFLFVFKYLNFFIESFSELVALFGFSPNQSSLEIILPVGISFYTFQTLSYTIDVYRGKIPPSDNIIDFFTYVSFFPQLVAGPIERASNLLPQFKNKRVFSYEMGKSGLRQILWGLFKKVVIADNCAIIVDSIFNNNEETGSFFLILGIVLFAFQIYGDFSGYSDIAIGTAKLLGFNLMQNFATPYFARDIAEFWRRWHISLSTWFRDYLYIPLGGSRVNQSAAIRNIFIIFLVSGFWHGANWTFIIWGGLHAVYYLPQFIFKTNRKFLETIAENRLFPSINEFFQVILTFSLVCLAWTFFRADNLNHSFAYLGGIFFNSNSFFSIPVEISYNTYYVIGIGLIIMLISEWYNRNNSFGIEVLSKNIIFRYSYYIILCLFIIQFFYGENSFIYFQF